MVRGSTPVCVTPPFALRRGYFRFAVLLLRILGLLTTRDIKRHLPLYNVILNTFITCMTRNIPGAVLWFDGLLRDLAYSRV